MRKFWNWVKDSDEAARTLYLDGVIAEESWFDDDVTPDAFRTDLFAGEGDITIWINSPGGDCVAASQIYSMLMDYKGSVTVKIDGLAASAASVIAMAGTEVLMAPTSIMMVHNPLTVAIGDSEEMQKAITMLDEFKESIMNAYEIKTGLSRTKISQLMDAETWLSAHKAVELGFADGLLFQTENESSPMAVEGYAFSRRAVTSSLQTALNSFCCKQQKLERSVAAPLPTKSDDSAGAPLLLSKLRKDTPTENKQPVNQLYKRLSLLK